VRELPFNLVISTAFVPRHVADGLRDAMADHRESPWKVVTHRLCPVVTRRAALGADDIVDLSGTVGVARHVDACIADRPEQLVLASIALIGAATTLTAV
jgi:hypothetical protein